MVIKLPKHNHDNESEKALLLLLILPLGLLSSPTANETTRKGNGLFLLAGH